MGRASGVVNIGGFVASLTTMAAIGIVLDLREPAGMGAYSLADFKVAMAVQYAVWALGCVQVLRYRRRIRARLATEGVVLAPLHLAVAARLRGSSAYR